jgi:hypothetical protein
MRLKNEIIINRAHPTNLFLCYSQQGDYPKGSYTRRVAYPTFSDLKLIAVNKGSLLASILSLFPTLA